MKGGLRRAFGKAKEKSEPKIAKERTNSLTGARKSIGIMNRKKPTYIPEQDQLPEEFDEYRNNLKLLLQLFEDLAKNCTQMQKAVLIEKEGGMKIADNLAHFVSFLTKTEASRHLGMFFYPIDFHIFSFKFMLTFI